MNIDYAHQYNLSLNHVGQGKVRIVFIWLCAGAIYLNLYIPMYFTSYDKYSSSLLVLVDDLRSVFGFFGYIQVDLLLAFCSKLGFSSVVLVGHDDGGLLALKAAQRVQESRSSVNVSKLPCFLKLAKIFNELFVFFGLILMCFKLLV